MFKGALQEAQVDPGGRTAELRWRLANGSWLVLESVASCIFDEADLPLRILLVSRDLTERKRAEQEIAKLAAFPRFNPNPVLEFAADGSLTYSNEAAQGMAVLVQKPHPRDMLPVNTAAIVKMCLATGQSRLHLQTVLCGRTISWSFFPVPGDQVVHCYVEDITARLQLEAQLRQVQKMESVGQLAAGLAHDFNNILTIIQGHAGLMLAETSLAPALAESLGEISQAATRATDLTRQLLLFSRKQILQPQLLDLNEVIHNVSKMLRTLLGEAIALERTTVGELPPIHADAGMLEQVLVNVAVNARDAMPKGGTLTLHTAPVELEAGKTSLHPEARPGRFVCLSVRDTGVGMEAGTLSRIFEPFFTTKERGRGTGLGLSTVYGIIQQHRGWIEVDSQPDAGTTFRIFLPISTKAPLPIQLLRDRESPGGHETILVVEDEPVLRDLVREILRKKGYRILEATTGVEALALWPQHRSEIQLLLTDMMMPGGISGLELGHRLQADKPDLRVLYTSGYGLDVVNPDFSLKDGVNFLQKPYPPETLTRLVRECLDR